MWHPRVSCAFHRTARCRPFCQACRWHRAPQTAPANQAFKLAAWCLEAGVVWAGLGASESDRQWAARCALGFYLMWRCRREVLRPMADRTRSVALCAGARHRRARAAQHCPSAGRSSTRQVARIAKHTAPVLQHVTAAHVSFPRARTLPRRPRTRSRFARTMPPGARGTLQRPPTLPAIQAPQCPLIRPPPLSRPFSPSPPGPRLFQSSALLSPPHCLPPARHILKRVDIAMKFAAIVTLAAASFATASSLLAPGEARAAQKARHLDVSLEKRYRVYSGGQGTYYDGSKLVRLFPALYRALY